MYSVRFNSSVRRLSSTYQNIVSFRRGQRRIALSIYQILPIAQPLVIIQAQQRDGSAANGGSPDNLRSGEFEVIAPALCTWIEQRHDFTAQRINRGQIGAFGAIADHAGQGQILFHSSATVFERDHVVYRMRFRPIILMDQAVLTSPASAVDHQSAQFSRNMRAWHSQSHWLTQPMSGCPARARALSLVRYSLKRR
jgi:hypothetical protein